MESNVLYLQSEHVNQSLIDKLDSLSFSKSGTKRLCLHKNELDPLHMMIVETRHNIPFPIHRHTDGDEISFILQGSLEVLIYKDGLSSPPCVYEISAASDQKAVVVQKNLWHQTKAIDPKTRYLEVKSGPFDKKFMESLGN